MKTPEFIFDVTLQNHGGYDTGLFDSYPYDGVTVNGEVIEGMSEYLSCVPTPRKTTSYIFLTSLRSLTARSSWFSSATTSPVSTTR